jgi:PAS domain S-box-containing protein
MTPVGGKRMAINIQFLRSAVGRISARTRVVIGLFLLLVGVLLLAITLGIVPNERRAEMSGRAKLCEAIAVQCSLSVARGDVDKMSAVLEPMLRRDEDILSAGIRREDGTIVTQFGDHASQWTNVSDAAALDSNIFVPIYSGEKKWGSLEIRFRPLSTPGVRGYLANPQIRLVGFVSFACLIIYSVYLRRMLQHLDPSKAVPPRVRSALDTLAEGLIVLDNEHRIVLANQAFAEIVGKPPEQLMGMAVSHLPWEYKHGATLAQGGPWVDVLASGSPARGIMMRLRDPQSNLRSFSVNCSPVLGGEGETRGVLVSLDDVTRLEQNELELRKTKDEAESANRAKSDFLARMSHEIRTPMNAILGFADILRRGYEESAAERQEYLETIHSSGQHLLDLINDILDLSKIEAGKLEFETSRCSPHALISEVASILSVRARQKGIALLVEWDGKAPATIQTDPTRLRQAITNLIGNAIKFTETGGVRVVARIIRAGRTPKLSIDVIDSGIGMHRGILGRIFQPFSQADTSITRRFGGTGLGLSISKQIAEALGGDISVSSEPGKGSTFTLTIDTGPLDGVAMLDPQAIQSVATSTQNVIRPAARLDGVRVLLAEDGASNRKLISLMLERVGAVIESAEDGQAAVALAMKNTYHVILMDMQMPIMDGYTAATMLRRKGLTIPIIALTAHAMRGDEEKCRAAGCSGFVTKPIDMDLLLRTIADAAGVELTAPAIPTQEAPVGQPTSASASERRGTPMLQSTLPTDDPEFCQIVVEFVDRLRSQVGAISDAWSNGDLEQLATLAHWVKGSGGTAGFNALTEPARELELAARDKRLDEVAVSISHLQDLVNRIAAPAQPGLSSPPSQPMSPEEIERAGALSPINSQGKGN